jgi:hypothetical protein
MRVTFVEAGPADVGMRQTTDEHRATIRAVIHPEQRQTFWPFGAARREDFIHEVVAPTAHERLTSR